MSAKLPVWFRGVTFGSHGDVYIIDNNNSNVQKHSCSNGEFRYSKPLEVKFNNTDLNNSRPLDISFMDLTDSHRDRILITTDNERLVFLSTDLDVKQTVVLNGRCTGLDWGSLETPGSNSYEKFAIFTLNATDNTLDILRPDGQTIQAISLPQKLGLREKHGYICCCRLNGHTVVILSSNCGVFVGTIDNDDNGQYVLNLRDEKCAEEKFSPQGVCVVGENLYVVNSRLNRVLKMLLVCEESGDIHMEYEAHMSVVSPCALDGRQRIDSNLVCVTTLTGRYELLDF